MVDDPLDAYHRRIRSRALAKEAREHGHQGSEAIFVSQLRLSLHQKKPLRAEVRMARSTGTVMIETAVDRNTSPATSSGSHFHRSA
jgi:metal-dependent HD superfamily phosphatase/phosphodiesterase